MKLRSFIVGALGLAVSAISVQAQPAIERGRYLVEGILTCGNCHSPRTPGGSIDPTRLYSGGPQTWDEPTFRVKGSNITPDPETGIGRWSEADTKRALQEGRRPDGTQLAPIMPYAFYRIFLRDDLDAVVAYLRSVPAVHNEVQRPEYKAALHVEAVPHSDKPPSEADMRDPVKRGFYLVTIGHCMECHSPMAGDRHDYSNLGRGGQAFNGPWGTSVSRNITSDPEKGIGKWTNEEIKRTITQGVRKDGSPMKPPMGYAWYARMTQNDLDVIVAYLRTLPP
jgi:mono/diheme cytochrome c family protein